MPNQTEKRQGAEKGLHAITNDPPTVPPPGQFQPAAVTEVASTESATDGSDHLIGAGAPHQKNAEPGSAGLEPGAIVSRLRG